MSAGRERSARRSAPDPRITYSMDLPIQILDRPPVDPVLSVDGAFGAPGLNLSHWPGNTTPPDLKRDLSTGIALAFAGLPAAERADLSAGCTALVNNHYDTDGVLAMFAVVRPDEALPRAEAMLAAAAAGDLFQLPSEHAFCIDLVVTHMADPARSPLDLDGLDDRARHERATAELIERLPTLLDGDLEPYAGLWRPELERLRADLALLDRGALDELVHLDLAVWTVPAGGDPGRHALFGRSDLDRQLVLATDSHGTTARLIIGTKSWFDLVSERPQPRPDLPALAARLNEAARGWQHQAASGASPELWYGTPGMANYSEHAGVFLDPCALDPLAIKAAVVDAVRATLVFSDDPDDDEDDGPWSFPT